MNGEQATLFRREALAQETDTWRAVLRTHPEIASFIDGISQRRISLASTLLIELCTLEHQIGSWQYLRHHG